MIIVKTLNFFRLQGRRQHRVVQRGRFHPERTVQPPLGAPSPAAQAPALDRGQRGGRSLLQPGLQATQPSAHREPGWAQVRALAAKPPRCVPKGREGRRWGSDASLKVGGACRPTRPAFKTFDRCTNAVSPAFKWAGLLTSSLLIAQSGCHRNSNQLGPITAHSCRLVPTGRRPYRIKKHFLWTLARCSYVSVVNGRPDGQHAPPVQKRILLHSYRRHRQNRKWLYGETEIDNISPPTRRTDCTFFKDLYCWFKTKLGSLVPGQPIKEQ